jgi:hypothetical protein
MIHLRRALMLGCISALLLNVPPVSSADFSLNILGIDSQRRPTISITGLTTGLYALDASTNLNQWFRLTSSAASAGPLTFLHQEASQLGTVYYRGLQLPDVAAIVTQVDSNKVATGLITFENGGALALTNETGVRYIFSVAPSNVLETVAIRMQLVTNFSSFPFLNESRTAVLFEPSGFQFHGGGTLEILSPTNIPTASVSSFSFNSQGTGFFLTPDVVETNRIRIPVTHFSGVGSALWTPSERTSATITTVENARDRMAHQVATEIAQQQNRNLQHEDPPTNFDLNELVISHQQDYYDSVLKPLFPQAASDCALAKFLIRELISMDHESQVLGITNGPASGFLSSPDWKPWKCNCIQEALEECENGVIADRTMVKALVGIERNAALLGGASAMEECGFGSLNEFLSKAAANKLPCLPEWFGDVTYSDGGDITRDCSGGFADVTCTATTSASLNFDAYVENVEFLDESFPPFFSRQTWTLKLFPDAKGALESSVLNSQKTPCGAAITESHREIGYGSGPLDLEIRFVFENNELTDFNIEMVVGGDLQIKTSKIDTSTIGPCPGGGSGSSHTDTGKGEVFLNPEPVSIDEVTFTKRTTTALEGTVQGIRVGPDSIIMPYYWTFSLHRNAP